MGSFSMKKIIALALIILAAVVAILFYWIPAPPKKIVIATGSKTGLYYELGQRFKERLAHEGITLEVKETAGSVENLKLLSSPKSGVALAFVQGGVGTPEEYPQLNTILGMYYEPLWVVYRPEAFAKNKNILDQFKDLKDKRVAIGAEGSGTLKLAQEIFKLNDIDIARENFKKLPADQAVKQLDNNQIDVVMLVAAARAPIVQEFAKNPRFKLMSLKNPKAYPSRLKYLNDVVVEQGVLNLINDVPHQPTTVLAPTAELVVHQDLHPALVALMVEASYDILQSKSLINSEVIFPSSTNLTFKQDKDAANFIKNGPTFIHRHLPFWLAVWVDRLALVLIPLIAILFPLFNIVPNLLDYRIRLRFALMYLELRKIEKDAAGHKNLDTLRKRFDEIEAKAKNMKVPKLNEKDLYDLRAHVAEIRKLLFSSVQP